MDAHKPRELSPFARRPHTASAATSEFSKTTSPTSSVFSRRLPTSQDTEGQTVQRGMRLARNSSQVHDIGVRSKLNDKGKEPVRGDILADNAAQHLSREHYVPTYDRTRPRSATTDGNINARGRFRGSILVAASDALGIKFGKRRPSVRQPPMPIILPDVIEISAPRADEEVEERNRLREMAAQAIGLGPFMVSPDTQSRDDSTTEEDDDQQPILDATEVRRLGYTRNSDSASSPNINARSPHGSTISVTQQPPPTPGGRFRSGSMLTTNPTYSSNFANIPSFPCTVSSLVSFRQCGGTYLKYYPPSSLRIFALSKSWKQRYLILSSPATLVTRGQGPAVSYLHLFKSSGSEDREVERLEINEDSVVFVAEEEVGGKRQVIKVAGVDVGAMKKEFMHDEGGHSMWLLQITDQAEAQKWITNIKNAILGQRTVRAGLIPAHTLGNNEPRGDMDVMLSIRAQGLITSPSSPKATSPTSSGFPSIDASPNYAASISSQSIRTQATAPKSSSTSGAVSALKSLFTGSSRPRSPSRAASIDSDRSHDRDVGEESFASMGSSLLNMLRSNTPENQVINTPPSSAVSRTILPFSGPTDRRLGRKILPERQPALWGSNETTATLSTRANRALSLGALSLQPPPRKRWTSVGPATASANVENPVVIPVTTPMKRTSLSLSRVSTDKAETEPPSSPQSAAFQFGTPEQRPRAPSLQSVSTYGSGENGISFERSSASTKRSSGTRSGRRWSRQGVLPNRLTPPSEPPPAVPYQSYTFGSHPFAAERGPSLDSARDSPKSIVNLLPTFQKRASGSGSVESNNSSGTTQSHPTPTANSSSQNIGPITIRAPASHRISVPPPRPAPTSALPPAPTEITNDETNSQDVLKPMETIPGTSKSSLRNSAAQRTFRLSMMAPKPPPSTTLPPRPDDPDYTRGHRRSSSGSTHTHSTKLESIPGSPVSANKASNPFPPPLGPLPPPPLALGPLPPTPPPTASTHQILPPPKRTTSLKQRLRILSTPNSNSNTPPFSGRPQLPLSAMSAASFAAAQAASSTAISPPSTPIAEKITLFQNDPSFLQMHTPILSPHPVPQALLPLPPVSPPRQDSDVAEVTSLSPPPRRGSKQLLETDLQGLKNVLVHSEEKLPTLDEPKQFSMSCPGSPVSPRSQRSELLFEGDFDRTDSMSSPDDLHSPEKIPSPMDIHDFRSSSRRGSVISLGIMSM